MGRCPVRAHPFFFCLSPAARAAAGGRKTGIPPPLTPLRDCTRRCRTSCRGHGAKRDPPGPAPLPQKKDSAPPPTHPAPSRTGSLSQQPKKKRSTTHRAAAVAAPPATAAPFFGHGVAVEQVVQVQDGQKLGREFFWKGGVRAWRRGGCVNAVRTEREKTAPLLSSSHNDRAGTATPARPRPPPPGRPSLSLSSPTPCLPAPSPTRRPWAPVAPARTWRWRRPRPSATGVAGRACTRPPPAPRRARWSRARSRPRPGRTNTPSE